MKSAASTWVAACRLLAAPAFVLFCQTAWAQADLVVSDLTVPSQAAGGSRISVGFRVTNSGDTAAADHIVGIYISFDAKIDQNDPLIGHVAVPPLAPGASTVASAVVALPADIGSFASTYYVGAYADLRQTVTEVDEGDNTVASAILVSGSVCEPDGFESDSTLAEAQSLHLGDRQSHNLCDGSADWLTFSAVGGKEYRFSTAERYNETANVQLAVYDSAGNNLVTTSSPWFPATLAWIAPATGTYYLRITQGWNTKAYIIALSDVSADLTDMTVSSAPTAAVPGALLRFSDSVINRGVAGAGPFGIGYYLSRGPSITREDVFLDVRSIGGLAPETYSFTGWGESLASVPLNIAPGNYYLGAIADYQDVVPEYRERNNAAAGVPIQINAPLCAADAAENDDWVAHAALVPLDIPQQRNHCDDNDDWLAFDAMAGESYVIETSGVGRRQATLLQLYGADGKTLLATGDPGTGGSRSDHTARIVWQAVTSGRYFVKASNTSSPAVGLDTEYTISVFRRLDLPDLKARTTNDISGGYKGTIGGFASLPLTVHNYGFAPVNASQAGLYLSTDWDITNSDLLLLAVPTPVISADDSNDVFPPPTFSFPTTLSPGTYYIGAIADHTGTVTELSEVNNVSLPLAFQLSAPVCAPDSYEQDDFREQAKPLALGVVQTHNHCDDGRDYLYVDVLGAGIYRFQLTSNALNTSMSVWDAAGNMIIFNEAQREIILTRGRHLIEGHGYEGANSDYTLSVTLVKKLRSRD